MVYKAVMNGVDEVAVKLVKVSKPAAGSSGRAKPLVVSDRLCNGALLVFSRMCRPMLCCAVDCLSVTGAVPCHHFVKTAVRLTAGGLVLPIAVGTPGRDSQPQGA